MSRLEEMPCVFVLPPIDRATTMASARYFLGGDGISLRAPDKELERENVDPSRIAGEIGNDNLEFTRSVFLEPEPAVHDLRIAECPCRLEVGHIAPLPIGSELPLVKAFIHAIAFMIRASYALGVKAKTLRFFNEERKKAA